MNLPRMTSRGCAALLLSALTGHAIALPVTFTDEAAFLAAAPADVALESFEDLVATNTRDVSVLPLDSFTISMSPGDLLGVFDTPDFFGVGPTDGVNYLAFTDGHDSVTYDFDAPQFVFGINIIDFGDFGTGSVIFTNDAGFEFTAAIDGQPNSNQQFFGLVSDVPFTQAVLAQNINGELYGVDELYFAAVPEPSALCLCLLSAAAAGMRYRKKKETRRQSLTNN